MSAGITVNVPGRLYDFSTNGESHLAYQRGEDPRTSKNLDADEASWFRACKIARRVRAGRGYYLKASLDGPAIDAMLYWAETFANASADDAQWGDSDARSDLAAANKGIERARQARRELSEMVPA